MKPTSRYQIVIGGVGGQGVLFVTRLLAEAAIEKGLPVFTSETHGMAQRGGTVISHLKVGEFDSPLIIPGNADGLIALKAESVVQHGGYVSPTGWYTVNAPPADWTSLPANAYGRDADRLAGDIGTAKSVNLIMLGFTLAAIGSDGTGQTAFFCNLEDIAHVLEHRLKGNADRLRAALLALNTGACGNTAKATPP